MRPQGQSRAGERITPLFQHLPAPPPLLPSPLKLPPLLAKSCRIVCRSVARQQTLPHQAQILASVELARALESQWQALFPFRPLCETSMSLSDGCAGGIVPLCALPESLGCLIPDCLHLLLDPRGCQRETETFPHIFRHSKYQGQRNPCPGP